VDGGKHILWQGFLLTRPIPTVIKINEDAGNRFLLIGYAGGAVEKNALQI
jgi:hypothetical protein